MLSLSPEITQTTAPQWRLSAPVRRQSPPGTQRSPSAPTRFLCAKPSAPDQASHPPQDWEARTMVAMVSLVPQFWLDHLLFQTVFILFVGPPPPSSSPFPPTLGAIGVNLEDNCRNYFFTAPAEVRVYRKTALHFTERVEKHLMPLKSHGSCGVSMWQYTWEWWTQRGRKFISSVSMRILPLFPWQHTRLERWPTQVFGHILMFDKEVRNWWMFGGEMQLWRLFSQTYPFWLYA